MKFLTVFAVLFVAASAAPAAPEGVTMKRTSAPIIDKRVSLFPTIGVGFGVTPTICDLGVDMFEPVGSK
jgi:hypothetical protein